MRIGLNPNKNKVAFSNNNYFHQIIIPVYIPNNEEYFKDSFELFRYSLDSLFKTCHNKTFFTIINNGSSDEVKEYLNKLLDNNLINELIHTTNIGKFNAILKGISGQNFPLVTITDADVFFLNNWQKETYEIFEALPRVGLVSTTPSSKMVKYLTSNIMFDNFWSNSLEFTEVKNKKAMQDFANSIGNPFFYNKHHLKKYLTLFKNNKRVVVGAGHFVGTYNRIVFDGFLNQTYSKFKMGRELRVFLDKPVIDSGFWRVSTEENFTYHLGNTKEKWMLDLFKDTKNIDKLELNMPIISDKKFTNVFNRFGCRLLRFLFERKLIWKRFLKFKGLTNAEAKEY